MYTIEDFKNGRVIIDNKTSPNPEKVKKIINSNFRMKASGDGKYYSVDPETGDWIVKPSVKSFGNFPVQNVDDFQIPDFYKSGDWVVVKSASQCREGNGIGNNNHIGKLRLSSPGGTKDVSGMLYEDKDVDFEVSHGKQWFRIRNSHIIRKVKENEIPIETLNVGDTYEFFGKFRIISEITDNSVHVTDANGILKGSFYKKDFLEYLHHTPDFKNYKSVLLTNNNNNQNEKTGKTSTVDTGKRTESSISSSSTRQIASASRLVGDSTHGKCKKTRIGRIEISSNAISF